MSSQDQDQRLEWLQNLKSGDDVILQASGKQSVRKVARTTAKQVFVIVGDIKEYERPFWKHTGCEVGANGWGGMAIFMPTPDNMQSIADRDELTKLRDWLNSTAFNLNQLRAMKTAYDDANTQ